MPPSRRKSPSVVSPLKPDQWPFATDEERAAGWAEPRFDRRRKDRRRKDRRAATSDRRMSDTPDTPSTEAGHPLVILTDAGRAMLRDPLYRHAVGHVRAIEREAAERATRQEAADASGLRGAAQWLVDIHADSVAIERGSALWEDLQRLRAALAQEAPERPLDVHCPGCSGYIVPAYLEREPCPGLASPTTDTPEDG